MSDPYDVIRAAVHEAWRLGRGTAIALLELHRHHNTPIEQLIDELRQRSAAGIPPEDT